MEEIKDEVTLKFLKYWEQRFKMIFEQNTNWTKLFLTIEQQNLPNGLTIEKFCTTYSQEFQMNISFKKDENANHYDLTITR